MTARWITPDAIFDGQTLRLGQSLCLDMGRVVAMGAVPEGAQVRPVAGLVSPGFVDVQVNGGGGVLFNAHPTPEGIATIVAAHRTFGTGGILPTVITDAPEVAAEAAAAVSRAWGMPGLLGLHIEGPHISTVRRGTHAERFVRPMDGQTLALVRGLRSRDIPVLITLAPEAATVAQIAELAATGAVVSIGHSDATASDVQAALAAGVTCFTHLFNAMSPMQGRAAGVVGAAINSRAYAGIICDGIHVADEMVGLAIRARPVADRMFLVSDAMPTVGGPDRFLLYGRDVHLESGQLVNDEGALAGAHVTMAQSVVRLVGQVGISPEQALRMAVTVPAAVIGRYDLATLVGRQTSDLIVLDDDLAFSGWLNGAEEP